VTMRRLPASRRRSWPAASSPAGSPSAPITAASSPPGTSAGTCRRVGSRTAAAAIAIRSPRAFIESWFGQFKKRLAWRSEWESLDQARREIGSYVNAYQHRPHSGLAYLTPAEVATTWRPDPDMLQTRAT
jgi:transposase InsO family protein